jgi:hypothetical protein
MELFNQILQVAGAITANEGPVAHSDMARAFWHLSSRSWGAMVAATSSSNIGLIIWTVSVAVGIWAAHRLKSWLEIRKRRPGWSGVSATLKSSLSETLWDLGATFLVVIVWWMVFVVRTVYFEHLSLSTQLNHLTYYAAHEEKYQYGLKEAQAKAERWIDAYTRISKGETVPDRIMNKEDTDRLHDGLEEYRKASKERRYSTIRIAPAFYGDQESSLLSQNLLKVFRGSHWNATWEPAHEKRLTDLILSSRPTNIVIFSDDPHNEALWILHYLSGIGLLATISDRVPDGFKGTLVCIGYKMFYPSPQ